MPPIPVMASSFSRDNQIMKKSNLKKTASSQPVQQRSRSSDSSNVRRFSNSSLHEIDQQIVTIQNEFEAELDTLIDARNLTSATPILADMRMVKSAEELQLARHAGQVAGGDGGP